MIGEVWVPPLGTHQRELQIRLQCMSRLRESPVPMSRLCHTCRLPQRPCLGRPLHRTTSSVFVSKLQSCLVVSCEARTAVEVAAEDVVRMVSRLNADRCLWLVYGWGTLFWNLKVICHINIWHMTSMTICTLRAVLSVVRVVVVGSGGAHCRLRHVELVLRRAIHLYWILSSLSCTFVSESTGCISFFLFRCLEWFKEIILSLAPLDYLDYLACTLTLAFRVKRQEIKLT